MQKQDTTHTVTLGFPNPWADVQSLFKVPLLQEGVMSIQDSCSSPSQLHHYGFLAGYHCTGLQVISIL